MGKERERDVFNFTDLREILFSETIRNAEELLIEHGVKTLVSEDTHSPTLVAPLVAPHTFLS